MKKTIALLSAAAIVAGASVTVFAVEGDSRSPDARKSEVTISTSVDPANMVSIPANTNVVFHKTKTGFGSVTLNDARLAPDKAVRVTINSDGELNNSADSSSVIPYTLTAVKDDREERVENGYYATLKRTGESFELFINITQSQWDAAAAGDYSDVVNFTIAYVNG